MGRNDLRQNGLNVLLEEYACTCQEVGNDAQVGGMVSAGRPHHKSAQSIDSFIRCPKVQSGK